MPTSHGSAAASLSFRSASSALPSTSQAMRARAIFASARSSAETFGSAAMEEKSFPASGILWLS
jgi:hypothetical protein